MFNLFRISAHFWYSFHIIIIVSCSLFVRYIHIFCYFVTFTLFKTYLCSCSLFHIITIIISNFMYKSTFIFFILCKETLTDLIIWWFLIDTFSNVSGLTKYEVVKSYSSSIVNKSSLLFFSSKSFTIWQVLYIYVFGHLPITMLQEMYF